MPDDDKMDADAVREHLARAVTGQIASLGGLTVPSGSARGLAGAGLKDRLKAFALAEVDDTHRLVEKLTALGGQVQPGGVPPPRTADLPALRTFLERERQLLTTLHAAIGPSGQEPQSEALEHPIEQLLLRRQQQVDVLTLALETGDAP